MKSILSLFIIVLFIFSCEKDSIDTGPSAPSTLPNLSLGKLKELIPIDILRSSKYVVYVNALNEERFLKLSVSEGIREQKFNLDPYNVEFFDFNLTDSVSTSYRISGRLHLQYETTTTSIGLFNISLQSNFNSGYIPSITLSEEGEPIFGQEMGSVTINERTFSNVVTQLQIPTEFSSYSKLYFSSEMGIVGFQGVDNEMWAFDRYE